MTGSRDIVKGEMMAVDDGCMMVNVMKSYISGTSAAAMDGTKFGHLLSSAQVTIPPIIHTTAME
jgi:hypothetical protein